VDKSQEMYRLAHKSLQKDGSFGEREETVRGMFSRFCRNARLTCQVHAIWQIGSSNDLKQERS